MKTFEYSIIRFVPKVEREEFLNIGVIVFSKPENFLDMRYVLNKAKILAMDPEADIPLLADYLQTWKQICEGKEIGGKIATYDAPFRFRWLTAAKSTIIQCSKPHPGISKNPGDLLDDLFQKYVV